MIIPQIQYDFLDENSWQSRITNYSFFGQIEWRITLFDPVSDGSYLWRYEDFFRGERREMFEIDVPGFGGNFGMAGQREWHTRRTFYDEDGLLSSMTIRYDSALDPSDGVGPQTNEHGQPVFVMQHNSYEDGVLRTIHYQDVAQYWSGVLSFNSAAKNWREKLVTYDENREISHQHVVFDNGSVRDVTYRADGARFAFHQDGELFGEADNFIWKTRLDAFGSDRQLEYRLQTFDNGNIRLTLHDDDGVSLIAYEDVVDTRTWYGRIKTIDSEGGPAQIAFFDTKEAYNAALPVDWDVIA